jgi:allantoinase
MSAYSGFHTPPNLREITVLASSRAIIAGRLTEATLIMSQENGKILSIFHSVLPPSDFPQGTPYEDVSPNYILPGLVDAHVHLNEPGRTEWEGFETGTRAAAFGGVTTLIDMPLNAIPPTTTVQNLRTKVEAAQGKCWVDVGFYGGLIPGNEGELKALVKEGVRGFKGFLIDSGVEEFPAITPGDVARALEELKGEPTTVMFHAEMIPPIADSVGDAVQQSQPPLAPHGRLTSYSTFLASRPPSFETTAIDTILSLSEIAPNLPLHIVHLSAAECVPLLREARANGVKITAETCFHYLALTAEKVKDGDTRHKCCPPIRESINREQLWQELKREDSVIRTIVSDHSPCTAGLKLMRPEDCKNGEKMGDFFQAWGGISSVGLGLSILWTEGEGRGIDLEDVVKWCCIRTAKQVGLSGKKGDISVGGDADVIVFDPPAEFVVTTETLKFKNKVSPYENKTLRGVVTDTYLRGRKIHSRETGFVEKQGPIGRLLLDKRDSLH